MFTKKTRLSACSVPLIRCTGQNSLLFHCASLLFIVGANVWNSNSNNLVGCIWHKTLEQESVYSTMIQYRLLVHPCAFSQVVSRNKQWVDSWHSVAQYGWWTSFLQFFFACSYHWSVLGYFGWEAGKLTNLHFSERIEQADLMNEIESLSTGRKRWTLQRTSLKLM